MRKKILLLGIVLGISISSVYSATEKLSLEEKIKKLEENYGLECAPEEIAYAKTYIEVAKGLKLADESVKVSKFDRYKLLKNAELKLELAEAKINADFDRDGVPCYLEVKNGTDPFKPDIARTDTSPKVSQEKQDKEISKEEKKSQVKAVTEEPLKLHARVHFEFDKANIKREYLPYLNVIVRYLKRHPDIKIKIVGYTDSIGSKAYNEKLALKRAKSVKQYLVKRGISPSRIEIEGIGKDKYLFDNKTALNRFTNRRAEFFIMKID
ncbi:MAG: OmpA family protein [Aquificae bacterium]|nr:OmpA family protein [Aquificota bacterium]